MAKVTRAPAPLVTPAPPVLVSCGGMDSPNLITVGWTGVVCSDPPTVAISVTPQRFSHHLIAQSGQFAINLPTEALARAVDFCGMKSGRDTDKFAALGLTALPSATLDGCPLLAESPVNLECRVLHTLHLGSHDMFVAQVVGVQVDEELLDEAGRLRLERAGLIVYTQGRYYALGRLLGSFGFSLRE